MKQFIEYTHGKEKLLSFININCIAYANYHPKNDDENQLVLWLTVANPDGKMITRAIYGDEAVTAINQLRNHQ